jgi:hypothetical protein
MNGERTAYRNSYSEKLLARVSDHLKAARDRVASGDPSDRGTVERYVVPSHLGRESLTHTVELSEAPVFPREDREEDQLPILGIAQRKAA